MTVKKARRPRVARDKKAWPIDPSDPKDTGFQYMAKPQAKIILNMLGTPIPSIPNGNDELKQMLVGAKAEFPEMYNFFYDIVVLKKTPKQGEGGLPQEQVAQLISQLTLDKLEQYEGEALNKMSDEYTKLLLETHSIVKKQAWKEIEAAAEKYVTIQYEIKQPKGKAKKIKSPLPENFQDLLDLAVMRKNILMVGPAGCGKTHVAGLMAEALGLDYAGQSCSAGMSESALGGWLLPVGNSGKFVYVSSEFVRIYENGGIFLFDELDAADPNVLIFVNQALANGKFHLPQRHEKPEIVKHPDFVAVAAANTYGGGADAMYTARNALDAATLDRFRVGLIEMDYSAQVEEQIIDPTILSWGRQVREVIESHSLRRLMSTRAMKDATDMKQGIGWDIPRIAKSYFADWSKEEMMMVPKHLVEGVLDQVEEGAA